MPIHNLLLHAVFLGWLKEGAKREWRGTVTREKFIEGISPKLHDAYPCFPKGSITGG